MSTDKAGTSAKQIERKLGCTYVTAWKVMHKIRTLMKHDDIPFKGEVEIDECFWHANTFKRSSARRRYGYDARRTGQIIFGIVERSSGQVKVWHVDGATATTLMPLIEANVEKGTLIHSDGYTTYRKLPRLGYKHLRTEHSKMEFYTEDSSTQNIENFWSTAKPRIKGTFRNISKKYISAYFSEFAWRYSHRNDFQPMFWSLMGTVGKT
jgi:transposase-like protein